MIFNFDLRPEIFRNRDVFFYEENFVVIVELKTIYPRVQFYIE